jgi:hypothetical protein
MASNTSLKEAIMRSSHYLVLLIFVFVLQSFSQTSVPPSEVAGSWKLGGSPYLIQGDITVPSESTLTVDPGVSVIFQGHYALNVQGRLLAIGTKTDSIRFTVSDTSGFSNFGSTLGGWSGIRLLNTPALSDSTILAFCIVQHGKAVGSGYPSNTGGGISIENFSKVRVSDCLITHCVAGGSQLPGGGGIGLTGAGLVLERNLITDNVSTGQAGALLVNGAKVWSTGNHYVGNSTPGPGGAIVVEGGSVLSLLGDSLVNNRSSNNGGGLQAYGQTQMTLERLSFIGNSANWGGGIAVYSCTLSVANCAFLGNTAILNGGGIGASGCSLDVGGNMIAGNTCGSEGGGLYEMQSVLRLSSSLFQSNRAGIDSVSGAGGSICAEGGDLHIDSCMFRHDTAAAGGGLRVYDCDLIADSVLIQEEYSSNLEAGLYWNVDSTGFSHPYTLSLRRVAFLGNTAKNNFAGAYLVQPTIASSLADVTVDQCAFVGNSANITPALGLSGTFKELVIANTIFQDNVAGSRTSGLSIAGGAQVKVVNCLFAGNYSAGASSVGAGLSMGANSDVDVVNCTIAYNTAASGSALSVRGGTKARVTNCIFWANSGAYIAVATLSGVGAHATLNYCDLQHGMDSISISDSLSSFLWGAGNIDGDPLFVDSLGADFHLSTGSHCIAAGVDSIEVDGVWERAPLSDIEGLPRPRPLGTHPDMGAFEEQHANPVSVERQSAGNAPIAFGLEQNYPNPFNPLTIIKYTIGGIRGQGLGGRDVSLIVYDVLGREVAVLVNERKMPGLYEVAFDGAGIASGVYIYRMTAESFAQTKKMILIR